MHVLGFHTSVHVHDINLVMYIALYASFSGETLEKADTIVHNPRKRLCQGVQDVGPQLKKNKSDDTESVLG